MNDRLISAMEIAVTAAACSRDTSVQNGAVLLAADNRMIGVGWNDIPPKVTDTLDRRQRPAKYLYTEHAERSAIYMAARCGLPTRGGTLVCPWAACADCARAIILSDIERLVRLPMASSERWSASVLTGDTMLKEAGVEILTMPLELVEIPDGVRLGQVVK